MPVRSGLSAAAVAVGIGLGCASCGDSPPGVQVLPPFTLTPTGGQLSFNNGDITIDVPAGALTDTTTFTVVTATATAPTLVGTAITITTDPAVTAFNAPIAISIAYLTNLLPPGVNETELGAYQFNGSWTKVPGSGANTSLRRLNASLTGPGTYGVLGEPVATVAVAPGTPSVAPGGTVQLTATPTSLGGTSLPGRAVTWSSSATGVATVNGSGLVTAVASGSATITATSEGINGTATVTVSAAVASVTVTPSTPSMQVGQNLQLTAVAKDAGGNTLTGRAITWASSATGIATVNDSGLVNGVAVGSATITATSEGVDGTATITVNPPSGFNEPAGFTPLVIRPFNTIATTTPPDNHRGIGTYPNLVGGSEGWDDVEKSRACTALPSATSCLTLVPAVDDPLSAGSAMRFFYATGLAANNGPATTQTLALDKGATNATPASPLSEVTDLYVRSSLRFDATYRVDGVGNKVYFHRQPDPIRGEPFLVMFNNGPNLQLCANFQGTPDNGLGFVCSTTAPGNSIARGQWYIVESLLIMNSAQGVADGIFRVWVDGVLVIERTNVSYIPVGGSNRWASMHISPTYGGSGGAPNPSAFWFDIGHMYISGRTR